MSSLKLYLLGSPRLERDGAPLKFHTRKNVALIAYLAMTPSPGSHTREALITLLWPELEPGRARANLRRNLSMLRKKLGDEWLVVAGEDVGLDPGADLRFDVAQFRALLRTWEGHGHPESDLCPRCLDALAEAAALYRGDFLAGFSLRDSPAFDEWQFFQTEGLRQELASALERLVRGHSAQGTFEGAIPHARRWLALDPLHEPVHRHLMRLYAQAGQQAAALRQYQECVRILEAELGLAPADETTALYEQIRTAPVEREASVQPAPLPPHNLPAQTTPFVGREEELAALEARLSEPDCRLLTLIGPGGTGKTRLALQAAADLISQAQPQLFEDGVFFVSLAPLQSAEAIPPAIARALDFSFYEDAQGGAGTAPQQQLLDYLRPKSLLLILDNFEHLLSPPSHSPPLPPTGEDEKGGDLVSALLRAAPGLKILATSRARLQVQGEHLFHVSGMRFPEPTPSPAEIPSDAAAYSAVQLFLQSARRVRSDFEPQADDWSYIAHICRLVQGVPLGILLAAGWVELLAPREIAAEISHSLDFLETDLRDVPERQRSLRAVFDHSWRLLTEREQAVFQGLSVFRGGFTRQAAQEVAGASLRDLMRLVNKSLLNPVAPERYEVHELLWQYAAEKLHSLPDAATELADRHCAYYTAALQRWEADLIGARQPVALAEMEVESGNVSAAWTWAVEQGQVERLDRAMEGLEHFYWQSGRYREAKAALQAAAAAAEAAAEKAADRAACLRVSVRALAWQSNFQQATGQRDAAQRLQRQCLAILQDPALEGLDTRLERAILSWSMGVTVCMADYAQGKQRFEESYSLFRELDHRWGMAWALHAWSIMSTFLGTYGDAKRRLEEGLAIHRALGNQRGVASYVSRLAEIAWRQGRFEEAERLAREGVATSLEVGGRTGSAFALLNLGEVLEKVAKFSEAHSVLQQSLELYTDRGHRQYITSARSFLGSVELHSGRYEEACDHAQTGLALAHEHGPRFCVGLNLLLLGCLELAQGAPATAYQLMQESAAVYREVGPKDDLGLALACLAIAARGLGDTLRARQHLSHALEIAQESGAVPPLLWALPATALLLVGEGENERAVELYAVASRFPLVAKSRWFADVAGKRLTDIGATLPPNVLAAAQERGRARDLESTVLELLEELNG